MFDVRVAKSVVQGADVYLTLHAVYRPSLCCVSASDACSIKYWVAENAVYGILVGIHELKLDCDGCERQRWQLVLVQETAQSEEKAHTVETPDSLLRVAVVASLWRV